MATRRAPGRTHCQVESEWLVYSLSTAADSAMSLYFL